MTLIKYSLFLLLAISSSFAAPEEDLITDLPGLDFPITFNQYSGYLDSTEGRKLHYWFVESKADPVTDPLLLWLNGGPGCSSLMGFITELGPFRVVHDGSNTLEPNIYAWNEQASVIFLESPACVGFSYDENDNCTTSDIDVANINYLALQSWFTKFPEYLANDFYVTGESYGGIYVPTLSEKIVQGQDTYPINFQGYAIGNGLLSYKNNDNSLLFYAYYHTILEQSRWEELVATCCENGLANRDSCDFTGSTDPSCTLLVEEAFFLIYDTGLNEYDLYGYCPNPSTVQGQKTEYNYDLQNLFKKNKGIQSRLQLKSDPPCTDNSYEMADEVSRHYVSDYPATTPQLAFLIENKIRGLIFNGDTDMACNFLGNTWDLLTIGLNETESRRDWRVEGQIAGYVEKVRTTLTSLRFKGSGHMVPQFKPEEALVMITSFLNNEPYPQ
ncbi:Lysosomal protective protein [Armadillidium nasatum]|uniref:Carboxypeptidase n=1 Tax=Armadillidium nasatum TaxID=96803 RepID=A0A5N5SP22_9CRUS|nr:Lysosomal protective protein [Armadillidium nasatum]